MRKLLPLHVKLILETISNLIRDAPNVISQNVRRQCFLYVSQIIFQRLTSESKFSKVALLIEPRCFYAIGKNTKNNVARLETCSDGSGNKEKRE